MKTLIITSSIAVFTAATLVHAQSLGETVELRVEQAGQRVVPEAHAVDAANQRILKSVAPVAGKPPIVLLAQAPPPKPARPSADASAAHDLAVAMATARGAFGAVFPARARQPVVVGAAEKDIPKIEEDMNIMFRILEKSAGAKEAGAKAMGIDVWSIGGPSAPRHFYLAGYGALFVLRVPFPLLPPAKAIEQEGSPEGTSTEWERARQEVYGTHSPFDEMKLAFRDPGEEFDESKVQNLKSQIINDLANAAHIQNLKPGDYVTVVVLGPAAKSTAITRTESRREMKSGAKAESERRVEAGGQTTMTLRAKKGDIDAFAKGKIKSEEFRRGVSVQVY